MKNSTKDFSTLYQNKCIEFDSLQVEYQEMKDISQQIEKELESEVEHLTGEKQRLLEENERIQLRLQELKKNYSQEISFLEKKSDRLFEENSRLKEEMKTKNRVITQNEIEIERLESQLRESQSIIMDLEYKIDHTIERLAMVQEQLEENRAQNEEEVQRLKEKLKETQSEVLAFKAKEHRQPRLDYLYTRTMEPENLGSYANVPGYHYGAYQAEGNDDPLPTKKVKVELGKRSYQRFEATSVLEAEKQGLSILKGSVSQSRAKQHLVGSFGQDERQVENGMFDFMQNKDQMNLESFYQNQLQSLNSLDRMNNGFSKSLSLVNGLLGELGNQSRRENNNNSGPFGNMF